MWIYFPLDSKWSQEEHQLKNTQEIGANFFCDSNSIESNTFMCPAVKLSAAKFHIWHLILFDISQKAGKNT